MSKLYDLLYSMIGKVNKAVKTETQVLTEEQKTQARANIGAMSSDYTPPNQTAAQVPELPQVRYLPTIPTPAHTATFGS